MFFCILVPPEQPRIAVTASSEKTETVTCSGNAGTARDTSQVGKVFE